MTGDCEYCGLSAGYAHRPGCTRPRLTRPAKPVYSDLDWIGAHIIGRIIDRHPEWAGQRNQQAAWLLDGTTRARDVDGSNLPERTDPDA